MGRCKEGTHTPPAAPGKAQRCTLYPKPRCTEPKKHGTMGALRSPLAEPETSQRHSGCLQVGGGVGGVGWGGVQTPLVHEGRTMSTALPYLSI